MYDVCSTKRVGTHISDDGHGFLPGIGWDAKTRFGCIIEQKWMLVPDADADARLLDAGGAACISPQICEPGLTCPCAPGPLCSQMGEGNQSD